MSDEYRLKFWNDDECLRNVPTEDVDTYTRVKEYVLETLHNRGTSPSMARRLVRVLADQAMFRPVRISFFECAAGGPRIIPSTPHRFGIDLSDGSRQVVMVRPLTKLSERVLEAELAPYYLWYADTFTSGMPFQLCYKNYPRKHIGNGIIL